MAIATRIQPGTRSNRMLTQRVITHLQRFYALEINHDDRSIHKYTFGPITTNYDNSVFEVYHSGNPILTVEKEGDIVLFTGGYHDHNGNPTSSTRELINGVMDWLEAKHKAPYVRAYINDTVGKLIVGETEHVFNSTKSWHIIR